MGKWRNYTLFLDGEVAHRLTKITEVFGGSVGVFAKKWTTDLSRLSAPQLQQLRMMIAERTTTSALLYPLSDISPLPTESYTLQVDNETRIRLMSLQRFFGGSVGKFGRLWITELSRLSVEQIVQLHSVVDEWIAALPPLVIKSNLKKRDRRKPLLKE